MLVWVLSLFYKVYKSIFYMLVFLVSVYQKSVRFGGVHGIFVMYLSYFLYLFWNHLNQILLLNILRGVFLFLCGLHSLLWAYLLIVLLAIICGFHSIIHKIRWLQFLG